VRFAYPGYKATIANARVFDVLSSPRENFVGGA